MYFWNINYKNCIKIDLESLILILSETLQDIKALIVK